MLNAFVIVDYINYCNFPVTVIVITSSIKEDVLQIALEFSKVLGAVRYMLRDCNMDIGVKSITIS